MSKCIRAATLLVAAILLSRTAQAEELPGTAASITVSGIVFERQLNGGAATAAPTPDGLTITSGAKTDFFRETDGITAYGNAPVILTSVDNTRPFTFTVKVAPQFGATYDAGALYMWERNDKWLKFAFERDERGQSRIVTVRTHGTSDDNNHDVVPEKSAYMRVSSDTVSLGFYYSVDGRSWHLVRLLRNDYPPRSWLGLSAQSPTGFGSRASFTEIRMSDRSVGDFRAGQ